MIERVVLEVSSWCHVLWLTWSSRGFWEWALCFAPMLLFLEIPRYYVASAWAVAQRLLGRDREDLTHNNPVLARQPLVSVVVAGRNEEEIIGDCVASLLEQDYPNLEILIIDDHSDDRTSERVLPFAEQDPRVRLIRNNAGRGRAGRPSASNLGLRLARGEFLVSLDADTTFDHQLVSRMVAPFADPGVGVVAGNVLIRNWRENTLTRLQALEYALAIDIHKRFTSARNATLQASGAVGAFRREGLLAVGGWEQQLAEDTDVSLRMLKAGWRLTFAADAVARTCCPTEWRQLARQRARWDRGGLRAFFKKHHRLLRPSVAGAAFAFELATEFFFAVIATVIYPFYVGWLLWQGPAVAVLVLLVSTLCYAGLSALSVVAVAFCTRRIEKPWSLLGASLLMPIYKEALRWVRFKATVFEILRVRYEDPFLPESAWVHAKRY